MKKGPLFEAKLCARCGSAPVKNWRFTYCEPCGRAVKKEAARKRGDRRRAACIRCGGDKDYGQGSRYCSACRIAMLPAWQRAERERGARRTQDANPNRRHMPRDAPEGMKWCAKCSQYRPYVDFSPTKSGLSAYCIPCHSSYLHARTLRKQFGITVEEYESKLLEQDGRCAICLKYPRARRLAVDHNHKTGAIRGLLCTRCNHKLLGASGDNPELLRRAADYLEKYA